MNRDSWLQHRTGLPEAVREFLNEPVPSSVGWRNTLGSLAGALLLVQLLTGFLLALYYVPHPDAAYASIQYIEEAITAGSFVRALHYWGASFIIVALFLHMARVFFAGAYKPPREATWLAGLALFGITVTLAFTGQLLPWNQMGYWAGSVGIEIASSAPVIGPSLKRLMVGHDSVGALTLTRFYAAHVVLLPALLAGLVGLHLYLLRRHGAMRPARDRTRATMTFFPTQLARDMVAISVGIVALMIVAATVGGPESDPADPSDTTYIPHPEWYFQAQYQLLRYMPGSLKIVATVIVPAIALGLLICLPWLDRASSTAVRSRRAIVAGGAVGMTAVVALTLFGTFSSPSEAMPAAATAGATYDIVEAGAQIYKREDCRKCHIVGLEGGDEGPDLTGVGLRLREDYVKRFLRDPKAVYPDIDMPAPKVNEKEMNELVAYLMSLREQ